MLETISLLNKGISKESLQLNTFESITMHSFLYLFTLEEYIKYNYLTKSISIPWVKKKKKKKIMSRRVILEKRVFLISEFFFSAILLRKELEWPRVQDDNFKFPDHLTVLGSATDSVYKLSHLGNILTLKMKSTNYF